MTEGLGWGEGMVIGAADGRPEEGLAAGVKCAGVVAESINYRVTVRQFVGRVEYSFIRRGQVIFRKVAGVMGKVWVEIVTDVSPDDEETKKALKGSKGDVEAAIVKRVTDALPGKYSTKDTDKPKDKTDNFAARAVRIVVSVKYKVEPEGKKLYSSGKVTVGVELLKLKSKGEKGELAGQGSKTISNVETRGSIDKDFVKASESLLDATLDDLVKKALDSKFESFAKQRNLPIE